MAAMQALKEWPIAFIEQPMAREHDAHLPDLKAATPAGLMHDESLVTPQDAERLLEAGVADAFNIRISKNGGFLASLRLAHFARKNDIAYQLGCMVGETSILSAVGRHFIESVPGIAFAEGSYGRFLLQGDVTRRMLTFGYGGRVRPMSGPGWGVTVDPAQLRRFAEGRVVDLGL
jgi:muconate cycloisomerase